MKRRNRGGDRKVDRFMRIKKKYTKAKSAKQTQENKDTEMNSGEEVADTRVYTDKGQYNATKQISPLRQSCTHIHPPKAPLPELSCSCLVPKRKGGRELK